jgi:hypothetical protein
MRFFSAVTPVHQSVKLADRTKTASTWDGDARSRPNCVSPQLGDGKTQVRAQHEWPDPKPDGGERASLLRQSVSEKDKRRGRESATLGLSRVRARYQRFLLPVD